MTIDTSKVSTKTIELKAPPNTITPQDTTSSLIMAPPMAGSMGAMMFMAISNNNNMCMSLTGGRVVAAILSTVVLSVYRQLR